jgi:hypothetical protein
MSPLSKAESGKADRVKKTALQTYLETERSRVSNTGSVDWRAYAARYCKVSRTFILKTCDVNMDCVDVWMMDSMNGYMLSSWIRWA